MKKFFITFGFIGMFVLYSLYQYFGMTSSVAYVAPVTSTTHTPVSTHVIAVQPIIPPKKSLPVQTTPTVQPTQPAPIKKNSLYVDGTYVGSVADAYYGNIQVQAVIVNGQITDVQFLQAPSDRSTSRSINNRADPILRAEAISIQSANVAVVSGASDSSRAFQQSLKSALTRAQNG